MAVLTILKDGAVIKTINVEGDTFLGRSKDCQIRLEDRAISRRHALFRKVGDGVQVEKKSEFAPLFINGAESTSAVLKEGDIVSVGGYVIRYGSKTGQEGAPATSGQSAGETASVADNQTSDSASSGITPADGQAGEGQSGDGFSAEEGSSSEKGPADSSGASSQAQAGQEAFAEGVGFAEGNPSEPSQDEKTKITAQPKLTAKLVFRSGTANVIEYEIRNNEVLIGRGKDCDVVLADKKCSRKNSLIKRQGIHYVIKDLNSSNGTFVNGVKISEQELSGDDVIKIGAIEFQIKITSLDYVNQEKDFELPPEESVEPAPNEVFGAEGQLGAAAAVPEMGQAVVPGAVPAQGTGEIAGIAGIAGISPASGGKKTLLERFRAASKRTQYLIIAVILLFGYVLSNLNEEEPVPAKGKKTVAASKTPNPLASNLPVSATFESLTPEQKKFVQAQHQLAFDYYKNKEYDKALFEIQKIFALVTDYKDSREIERYAKEGRRKLEALEEERRKKEEEAKLKAKVAELVEAAQKLMDQSKFDQAKELFTEILTIDPDNPTVAGWRKQIETYEEQLKLKKQQEQVQSDINQQGWKEFKEGLKLKKEGHFYTAIASFQKVMDIGSTDKKLVLGSRQMIARCKAAIKGMRDPVLAEAKKLEESGDYVKAFALYQKATRIDPYFNGGYAGMNRIKGVLHERARGLYTEAILAESYSDFETAYKKFQECLSVAPQDDIYHDRSLRRLGRYIKKWEDTKQ